MFKWDLTWFSLSDTTTALTVRPNLKPVMLAVSELTATHRIQRVGRLRGDLNDVANARDSNAKGATYEFCVS